MPARPNIDKPLRELMDRVSLSFPEGEASIILFGSRARGSAGEGSDYDCLVLLPAVTPEIRDKLDKIAGDLLVEYGAVISLLPVARGEYTNGEWVPLFRRVREEGINLGAT